MTTRNSVVVVENFWKQVWQSRDPDASTPITSAMDYRYRGTNTGTTRARVKKAGSVRLSLMAEAGG